jgi:hypothetical protein
MKVYTLTVAIEWVVLWLSVLSLPIYDLRSPTVYHENASFVFFKYQDF